MGRRFDAIKRPVILQCKSEMTPEPTPASPPTAQTIELENILREDAARPSLERAEVLANAPEQDGRYVSVPAILGGD